MAELRRGDRVADPTDPSKTAVVVGGPSQVGSERFYLVRVASDEELFFAERELTKQEVDLDSPVSWLAERSLVDPERLARMMTQLKLTSGLTDVVYSFSSTRTLFRVHQFKPVLKVIESPVQRLLLADEVGLGKTIEAGLVWSEIDARAPVQRVLILCPSGLRQKWQREMERRFDREVPIVDRTEFMRFLDLYEARGDALRWSGIASFSQLRSDIVLDALSRRPPTFDLVIIDEAHALRNTNTKTHQLGELLAQNSAALLLLSATPVNLGSNDLFNLLRLLRPDEYDDPFLFAQQLEPNEHINRAGRLLRLEFPPDGAGVAEELRRVEETSQSEAFRRNPVYHDVLARLEKDAAITRRQVAELQRDLASLNTLSSIYTRTRKRDLKDQTTTRRPRPMKVEFTDEESAAYLAVVKLVGELKRRVHGVAPALAAVMPARQAASCLPVMREYLRRLADEGKVVADLEESEELDDPALEELGIVGAGASIDADELSLFESVERICERAERFDTKFDVLAQELGDLRREGAGKVLLFSTFLLTLDYLHRRLSALGYHCRVMTGATPIRERDHVIDDFRNGDLEILLCSEIGSEGLDFEFCNVLVNYDLPWNPMRLEQRIGRLDRFGQPSPVIHVLNFNIPGTIDTEIFLRLYTRIGIFERSIGELEPILGEQLKELTRAMASSELTLDEQRHVADQVALAVESEKQELDAFEQAKDKLMGADAFVEDTLTEAFTERRFITPEEVTRYVEGFLREEASPAKLEGDVADEVRPLVGSPALGDHLRGFGGRLSTPQFQDLVTALESGGALPVTFEADAAYRHRAEFLNLRHPIVRSIAKYYEGHLAKLHRGGYCKIPSERWAGSWIFFVFLLSATGLSPRRSLFAVGMDRASKRIDSEVGQEILSYLAGPDPEWIRERDIPILDPDEAASAYEAVLGTVAEEVHSQQAELQQRNDSLISVRQETLRHGSEVRAQRLRELAGNVSETSPIRRMRVAQATNLVKRTEVEIDTLEQKRVVRLGFNVVAGGLADFVATLP